MLREFPYCCTAKVLVDFGETATSEGGSWLASEENMRIVIKEELQSLWSEGHALVAATTNNKQKTANKVLRSLGFKRTIWMRKKLHPETLVALWHLNMEKYTSLEMLKNSRPRQEKVEIDY